MTFSELDNYLKALCKKAAEEGRPFEDLFSAFQSEIIRNLIDRVEKRAEKVYFYSDLEEGAITLNWLFRIDGEYYTEGGIEKAVKEGRMSSSLTKQQKHDITLTIVSYDTAVRWLCKYYGKSIPTVIKLIYNAKTRQVEAKYGYERLKSLSEDEYDERYIMWFDEIRAKNL